MPSGWTTSGIDWSSALNMRKSRTEDIVRELYKATHERDFWVRRWTTKSSNNYSTEFPSIPTQRLENQIEFIYTTLQDWLTTDLNPLINTVYVENKAVWIDENQIPTGQNFTNTVNLGIPHWDMAENGNLETELSMDLSFLRNYTGGLIDRISLNDMKKVYDILNFLTKCRCYQIEYNGGVFTNDLQVLGNVFTGNGIYVDNHTSDGFQSTALEAYNKWANSTPTPITIPQLANEVNSQQAGVNAYLMGSFEAYYQFLFMVGFDGNNFEASDFDFNMLFYKKPNSADPNPNLNMVDYINSRIGTQGSKGVKAYPFPNTDLQSFPPQNEIYRYLIDLLPYADMNKEGFLKYYTEPTN